MPSRSINEKIGKLKEMKISSLRWGNGDHLRGSSLASLGVGCKWDCCLCEVHGVLVVRGKWSKFVMTGIVLFVGASGAFSYLN